VEKRLMDEEEQLKLYREKFMGGLPEQLDTNLRILERLQAQLDQLGSNLRDAENRKLIIQHQIGEAGSRGPRAGLFLSPGGQEETDLAALKNQLSSLEARYTDKHPDVIRLKKMIDNLAAEEPEVVSDSPDSTEEQTVLSAAGQAVRQQARDIDLEVMGLKSEIKKTKSQIKWYQSKVGETPKREQELLSLRRDYNNLMELYNSVLNRKLEAEMAVSMEKKQKGEQFRVIDPAKIPIRPEKPDVRKIILLALALGLGSGGGLAYLLEFMDTSYRTPEDVETELRLPVLVSMPLQYTEKELKIRKWKEILTAASVAVVFVLSAVGIVLTVKGVDNTVNYMKEVIGKM